MLSVRLAPEIMERLELLAHKIGRTKSFHAREAILRYLEDMEDTFITLVRSPDVRTPDEASGLRSVTREASGSVPGAGLSRFHRGLGSETRADKTPPSWSRFIGLRESETSL